MIINNNNGYPAPYPLWTKEVCFLGPGCAIKAFFRDYKLTITPLWIADSDNLE